MTTQWQLFPNSIIFLSEECSIAMYWRIASREVTEKRAVANWEVHRKEEIRG